MEKERLVLYLDAELINILKTLSQNDCRSPSKEMMWLLNEEAKRRGLMGKKSNSEVIKINEVRNNVT